MLGILWGRSYDRTIALEKNNHQYKSVIASERSPASEAISWKQDFLVYSG
jgi:hypothetical protein